LESTLEVHSLSLLDKAYGVTLNAARHAGIGVESEVDAPRGALVISGVVLCERAAHGAPAMLGDSGEVSAIVL
jgi:hypothetical protein